MIAIIAALKKELEDIFKQVTIKKNYRVGPGVIYLVETPIGELLLITTGIGKTAAAMVTQYIIDKFKIDKILVTGFAGALNTSLEVDDLIIPNKVLFYDVDYLPFVENEFYIIDKKNEKEFLELYFKFNQNKKILNIDSLVTGDKIVRTQEERKKLFNLGFDAVDMETASIFKVASFHKIQLFIIKKISDI